MEAVLKYFSSSRFIISLCIAIAALVVWLLVRQIIHRFADRITSAGSLSGRRQTYLALSLNIVRGLLVLAALILILQIHGVNVSSLVAGLGIVGAIVGLALQDMLKDMIMGCNILTGEYFAVGDVVKYGALTGEVVQFSLRSTKIRELATNNIVTVSNRNILEIAKASNELFLTVPTAYEADPAEMETFLTRLAQEAEGLEGVEKCSIPAGHRGAARHTQRRAAAGLWADPAPFCGKRLRYPLPPDGHSHGKMTPKTIPMVDGI